MMMTAAQIMTTNVDLYCEENPDSPEAKIFDD
jgi:hypothetical protein